MDILAQLLCAFREHAFFVLCFFCFNVFLVFRHALLHHLIEARLRLSRRVAWCCCSSEFDKLGLLHFITRVLLVTLAERIQNALATIRATTTKKFLDLQRETGVKGRVDAGTHGRDPNRAEFAQYQPCSKKRHAMALEKIRENKGQ